MGDVLIHKIGTLATPLGESQNDPLRPVHEIQNAAILIRNGRIAEIGDSRALESRVGEDTLKIDADGCLALPGLIDCHTHPVYVGNRADEFHLRNAGKSYQEIAAAGGGIQASARKVAAATVEQIVKESLPRFDRSLAGGVTTIEAKSGYGLDFENELKLLRALEMISGQVPQRVLRTLLIHAVPAARQAERDSFVREVCQRWIPDMAARQAATGIDVFCESGAFTVEESRVILSAGKNAGLRVTIHANQFGHSGGASLAAEMKASSADHLEYLSEDEIAGLARAGVCGVILPACVFFLGSIPYPPARKMIDGGMRVAIATDMNPGSSMTESLPFCLTAAAVHCHLSPQELLWGVTFDAARALNIENEYGSLEVGKSGDVSLWKVPSLQALSYYFGDMRAAMTIVGGDLAWEERDGTERF